MYIFLFSSIFLFIGNWKSMNWFNEQYQANILGKIYDADNKCFSLALKLLFFWHLNVFIYVTRINAMNQVYVNVCDYIYYINLSILPHTRVILFWSSVAFALNTRLLRHNDPDPPPVVSECRNKTDRRMGRRYTSTDARNITSGRRRRRDGGGPLIRCIVSAKLGKHNGGTLSIMRACAALFRRRNKEPESGQQIGFKVEEPRRFPPLWSGH